MRCCASIYRQPFKYINFSHFIKNHYRNEITLSDINISTVITSTVTTRRSLEDISVTVKFCKPWKTQVLLLQFHQLTWFVLAAALLIMVNIIDRALDFPSNSLLDNVLSKINNATTYHLNL